jgi:ketosteroid isomerase-like protein
MNRSGYATPQEAETAFYQAFELCDLAAMMDVWADREFIECIHPVSERLQGRRDIENSWRQIFDSGLRVDIQRSGVHRTQDALLAVHVLYEHLSIPGRNERHPPVIATNIYQLIDGSWRMVLHHASPSPQDEAHKEDEDPVLAPQSHQLH